MYNEQLLPAFLALAMVLLVALVLGSWIHRLEKRRGLMENRDQPLVGDAINGTLGFLGGSAAFLLGVLMMTSIDHFNATKEIVRDEALAYSAAFDATVAIPAEQQLLIRHDLVCLMQSVVRDSWNASEANDLTGDENTQAWMVRVFANLKGYSSEQATEQAAIDRVQDQLGEAMQAGQTRLLSATVFLPFPLWVVVYLSVFILLLVVTVLMRPNPLLQAVLLACMFLLSASMIWALVAFQKPFNKSDGVYIAPDALEAVMIRLRDVYPGPAWEPCERLATSERG